MYTLTNKLNFLRISTDISCIIYFIAELLQFVTPF